MNHKQKKILRQAFRMLVKAADEGARLLEAGASHSQLAQHARDIEELAREVRRATEVAKDVEAVAAAHRLPLGGPR